MEVENQVPPEHWRMQIMESLNSKSIYYLPFYPHVFYRPLVQILFYFRHIINSHIIKMLPLSSCVDSRGFMQTSKNYLHDTVYTQDTRS